MLFLPNDDALEAQAKSIIDDVVAAEGLKVLGYRKVPVADEVVGRFAKATQPRIWQVRRCVMVVVMGCRGEELKSVGWVACPCIAAAGQRVRLADGEVGGRQRRYLAHLFVLLLCLFLQLYCCHNR